MEADVLVLGSSDVEAEGEGGSVCVDAVPLTGEGDAESEDELDEWGMPPSGQGR